MSTAENRHQALTPLRQTMRILDTQLNGFMLLAEEIGAMRERMKHQLDSMSEIGEIEQMVLQLRTDHLQKALSTMANVIRKIEATNQSIIGNIK